MQYTSKEVYEFISRQTNDPIIEWKTCVVSGQQFPIFQSDLHFYAKISPTFNNQKFQIPTPTLCPEERQRRRLSFRNERKLYRRQCDASKKSIISIYSPDKPYKVYDQKIRWSDAWDPMDYGFEFDFSKTFTEQFSRLMTEVPQFNLANFNNENSEYVNYLNDSKNCYLTFGSGFLEDSCFSNRCYEGKRVFESSYSFRNEEIYQGINCENSHNLMFCQDVKNSSDCYGCLNCDNCTYCIGCTNTVNARYKLFNTQYSQDEYHKTIQNIQWHDIEFLSTVQNQQQLYHPLPSLHHSNSEHSIGDYIRQSNHIVSSFEIDSSEHCSYSREIIDCKDCRDINNYGYSSLCYDLIGFGYSHRVAFTLYSVHANDTYYSAYCQNNCSHCFGCIGLRNKSYCIFNKQYTKEEYEIQVAKIITHMQTTGERGEFFHPSLSPFGYNETVAQEYYPIQKLGEVGELGKLRLTSLTHPSSLNFGDFGYHRSTYNADPSIPEGVQTIERKNYSDEQRDSLLQEDNLETKVFLCSVSSRPYRLQKAEIEFYRKHSLPIPDKHPDIRHEERMKLRPGRTLFLRNCNCCGKEMLSVYPQDHEGKVYCEECYQKEVYA